MNRVDAQRYVGMRLRREARCSGSLQKGCMELLMSRRRRGGENRCRRDLPKIAPATIRTDAHQSRASGEGAGREGAGRCSTESVESALAGAAFVVPEAGPNRWLATPPFRPAALASSLVHSWAAPFS